VQRKVFRVERMFAGRAAAGRAGGAEQTQSNGRKPAQPCSAPGADSIELLKRELALLHDVCARNRHELLALLGDGGERRMAHAASKLGAAVEGMEKATVKILKSAESIDESAKALTATLKSDYQRGLALDIQEQVVAIYEACNFQDLSGQRIGSVVATLSMIEDRLSALLHPDHGLGSGPSARADSGSDLLNGPRLDGASGHTTQDDIDALFG